MPQEHDSLRTLMSLGTQKIMVSPMGHNSEAMGGDSALVLAVSLRRVGGEEGGD